MYNFCIFRTFLLVCLQFVPIWLSHELVLESFINKAVAIDNATMDCPRNRLLFEVSDEEEEVTKVDESGANDDDDDDFVVDTDADDDNDNDDDDDIYINGLFLFFTFLTQF